jgi:hypothetical protein
MAKENASPAQTTDATKAEAEGQASPPVSAGLLRHKGGRIRLGFDFRFRAGRAARPSLPGEAADATSRPGYQEHPGFATPDRKMPVVVQAAESDKEKAS